MINTYQQKNSRQIRNRNVNTTNIAQKNNFYVKSSQPRQNIPRTYQDSSQIHRGYVPRNAQSIPRNSYEESEMIRYNLRQPVTNQDVKKEPVKKLTRKQKKQQKKLLRKQIKKDKKKRVKKSSKAPYFIGGLFGILLGVSFLGHPILVDGQSMLPNFQDGELIYTMNLPKKINRFDVVIVKNDSTSKISENALWIKRVIGLPGETIEFKNGSLYVNNKKVKEPFSTESVTTDFGPVTLGDDEYWIMGDNRDNSCDSRYIGTFKRKDIKYVYCFELPYPDFLKK